MSAASAARSPATRWRLPPFAPRLSSALRDEDFAHMIPLATAWTDGVQATIDRHALAVARAATGRPRRVLVLPAARDGAAAAAAVDDELDAFMHLWAINRGILLTPFHNMALMSPHHTAADVDAHTEVFADRRGSIGRRETR